MNGLFRFLPTYLLIALLATLAAIGGSYAYRVHTVRGVINRAVTDFEQGRIEEGFRALDAVTPWAAMHPVLMTRLYCASITGHIRSGRDDRALALARTIEAGTQRPAPASVWDRINHATSRLLDHRLLDRETLADTADAGYETIRQELARAGDPARRTRFELNLAPPAARGTPVASTAADEPPAPDTPPATPPAATAPPPPRIAPPRTAEPVVGEGQFACVATGSARVFNTRGKAVGTLNAGAFVTVEAYRDTPSGEVAVCRYPGSTQAVVILTRDLETWQGNLDELSDELKDLLKRSATIQAAIRERRQALATNPHLAEYARTRDAYQAFYAQTRELTNKRDAATGSERIRYANELQGMKDEGLRLREAFEQAKRQYLAWKAAHDEAIESDSRIATLRRELDKVRERLTAFSPGES